MQKQTPQNPYPTPTSPAQIASQFGMTPIPYHQHTGADSPQVQYTNVANIPAPVPTGVTSATNSYAGMVNADGTANFLPTGWTSSVGGVSGKHYTVTHNLNTTNYSVAGGFPSFGSLLCTYSPNSVDIVLGDTSGTAQNYAFHFILTTQL